MAAWIKTRIDTVEGHSEDDGTYIVVKATNLVGVNVNEALGDAVGCLNLTVDDAIALSKELALVVDGITLKEAANRSVRDRA